MYLASAIMLHWLCRRGGTADAIGWFKLGPDVLLRIRVRVRFRERDVELLVVLMNLAKRPEVEEGTDYKVRTSTEP